MARIVPRADFQCKFEPIVHSNQRSNQSYTEKFHPYHTTTNMLRTEQFSVSYVPGFENYSQIVSYLKSNWETLPLWKHVPAMNDVYE